MQLIDTHCHLFMEPLATDAAAVRRRAAAAGVGQIVVPAYDTNSWAQVTALAADRDPMAEAEQTATVYPALGLHPWAAAAPLDLARLARALTDSNAVALGEIGLDFKVETPAWDQQIGIFEAQLDLARQLELPVILHNRGAFEEMLTILGRHVKTGYANRPLQELRGVVHAFSRGPELAQRFIDLGFCIAFGGAITRSRAKSARRSAESLPLDRIVLETDAPSIGLDGVDPERTEPRHVTEVAAALAEIRGESLQTIQEVTSSNARALFGLPDFS
ncbi:MAG: TatD family hydrolase [bacterium]